MQEILVLESLIELTIKSHYLVPFRKQIFGYHFNFSYGYWFTQFYYFFLGQSNIQIIKFTKQLDNISQSNASQDVDQSSSRSRNTKLPILQKSPVIPLSHYSFSKILLTLTSVIIISLIFYIVLFSKHGTLNIVWFCQYLNLHKWTFTIYILVSLASFTQQCIFKIHPGCYMQLLLFFYFT